ncbi:VOC family protein [Kitasatospora sp. NPDC048365]|uniref:VOC family protein n=1 Tax=Kitasatospora sp. NPDC048365 TaxID=3364050 RepID=UPI00371EE541
MPEVTERYLPGTPCWVDLMAKNQQEALDFYRDVFGWQGEVGPAEFGGYTVCTLNDRPVAGIGQAEAPDGAPPPPTVWTTYLATEDADAALAAITANGGTSLTPVLEVGDTGRMLVALDPTGAVFGLWQPVEFPGAQVVNEPGALTWNELHTTDPDVARAFYEAALSVATPPMEGAHHYWQFAVNARTVGGLCPLDPESPAGTPSHWLTYFAVDDTDSTVDALVRRGGSVLVPPADSPWGRVARVRDPQGAAFAVIRST